MSVVPGSHQQPARRTSRFQDYYQLTKPGIIRGNALAAVAGFCLGVPDAAGLPLRDLSIMLIGLSLVIASGCVVNNYIDRLIDAKMARTRNRALVSGRISPWAALSFATVLGLAGGLMLAIGNNLLAAGLSAFGWFAYVYIYGAAKRRSVHGTLIGSISGAVPPVVGYTAASGRLDLGAVLLCVVLVAWQMPHFYAIAMYRLHDYQSAHIPVLPAVRGMQATKQQIMLYIALFLGACSLFTVYDYTSYWYLAVMATVGCAWLLAGIPGYNKQATAADTRWAKRMLGMSLLTLSVFCVTVSLDTVL